MSRLLILRKDSFDSGLCESCPHLVSGLCDTGRECGQVLACRCQKKAMINGRFPSGRVRPTPPKRVNKGLKINAWAETRARMYSVGKDCGLIWIKFLSKSQQVIVRRCVKSGKLSAVHLDGVNIHGIPATFLSIDELKSAFDSWVLPSFEIV